MKTIDLHEIAYNEGLELVSTTTGMNGYPKDVNYALIGLDDFQQAETLVKKISLFRNRYFAQARRLATVCVKWKKWQMNNL